MCDNLVIFGEFSVYYVTYFFFFFFSPDKYDKVVHRSSKGSGMIEGKHF